VEGEEDEGASAGVEFSAESSDARSRVVEDIGRGHDGAHFGVKRDVGIRVGHGRVCRSNRRDIDAIGMGCVKLPSTFCRTMQERTPELARLAVTEESAAEPARDGGASVVNHLQ
jgi:hypothetical protein